MTDLTPQEMFCEPGRNGDWWGRPEGAAYLYFSYVTDSPMMLDDINQLIFERHDETVQVREYPKSHYLEMEP